METVFTDVMELKGYLLIEDVLAKGPVCPFFSKLHTKPVSHGPLHPRLCNIG